MTNEEIIKLLKQCKTITDVNYLRYIWVRQNREDMTFNVNVPKELR